MRDLNAERKMACLQALITAGRALQRDLGTRALEGFLYTDDPLTLEVCREQAAAIERLGGLKLIVREGRYSENIHVMLPGTSHWKLFREEEK